MNRKEINKAWPESVPVLSPREIGRLHYRKAIGKPCCLIGHAEFWFKSSPLSLDACLPLVKRDLKSAIKRLYPAAYRKVKAVQRRNGSTSRSAFIICFNDRFSTARMRARVWNAAMRKRGYTVPCERPVVHVSMP